MDGEAEEWGVRKGRRIDGWRDKEKSLSDSRSWERKFGEG